MPRILLLTLITTIAFALGLCVAAPKPAATRLVTATEKNTKVSLGAGDTLLVRLESTPGTGYGWQVTGTDAKLLKQLGEPVLEDSGKHLPGAPQHQAFRFKALAVGVTTLVLHYVRPWEKNKPPARIYKLQVTITKTPRSGRK